MWSKQAERLVSELIAELPSEERHLGDADRLDALPIGVDMWSAYYLRPNGEVVIVGEDFDRPEVDTVVSDWKRVLGTLVWGARRYPRLRELLPVRGSDAIDCWCRTHPLVADGKMICSDCGGMGWLPGPNS